VTVQELYEALDGLFPFAEAGVWDEVGLQVGGWSSDAGVVAVAHEVTDQVVSDAIARGIGTIVTYHPLLFTPTTTLIHGSSSEGRAVRLAAAGTNVISVHTAFDVAKPGTADALLRALGVEAHASFGPVDDESGADIGRTARLAGGMTIGALCSAVESASGSPTKVNAPSDRSVSTIGVVPGSGGSFIAGAVGMMDVMITGDVSHHEAAYAAANELVVIDAGHIPSERAGVEAMYAAVCTVEPDAVYMVDNPNPWEG